MSVPPETESSLRVFISYSQHDPAKHSPQVLAFGNALLDDGIEVELDQYHQEELIDWPRWCEERLRLENSNFVLMICSAEYKRRIENRVDFDKGRGVFWEGNLIYNALYKAKANERFIPILFGDESEDALPSIIEGWTRFTIRAFGTEKGDLGYTKLYRFLTKQPTFTKPKVGKIKILRAPDGRTSEAAIPDARETPARGSGQTTGQTEPPLPSRPTTATQESQMVVAAATEPSLLANFPRPPGSDEIKVIEVFKKHLHPAEMFHVWPRIPNHKLTGAKGAFLALRDDELLLALCDTTVFKHNGKNGFALTTRRIYWKNLLSESKELEYRDLVGPIETKDTGCSLGNAESISGAIPDLGNLSLFLKMAAAVFGTRLKEKQEISELSFPRPPTSEELSVIEVFKKYLHAAENFYIAPDIPGEQWAGAKASFVELLDDELLLALGDITYFAKNGKYGFALTTRRIYWRNIYRRRKELEYRHLVGPMQTVGPGLIGGGTKDYRGTFVLSDTESINGPTPDNLPLFLQAAAGVFGIYVEVKEAIINPEYKMVEMIRGKKGTGSN
ncbi:MAG: toll/interleukin-1 receptor domain-containing protein [Chthoniobacterales bacterium]